jgi:hypothetical protein
MRNFVPRVFTARYTQLRDTFLEAFANHIHDVWEADPTTYTFVGHVDAIVAGVGALGFTGSEGDPDWAWTFEMDSKNYAIQTDPYDDDTPAWSPTAWTSYALNTGLTFEYWFNSGSSPLTNHIPPMMTTSEFFTSNWMEFNVGWALTDILATAFDSSHHWRIELNGLSANTDDYADTQYSNLLCAASPGASDALWQGDDNPIMSCSSPDQEAHLKTCMQIIRDEWVNKSRAYSANFMTHVPEAERTTHYAYTMALMCVTPELADCVPGGDCEALDVEGDMGGLLPGRGSGHEHDLHT